jgi:hypothetical protein
MRELAADGKCGDCDLRCEHDGVLLCRGIRLPGAAVIAPPAQHAVVFDADCRSRATEDSVVTSRFKHQRDTLDLAPRNLPVIGKEICRGQNQDDAHYHGDGKDFDQREAGCPQRCCEQPPRTPIRRFGGRLWLKPGFFF